MRHSILSLFASLVFLLQPGQAAAQGFGSSAAVSAGDVLVGESLNERDPGYVYVYRRSEGSWVEVQRLSASDAVAGDHFGRALGVVDGDLLVGATVVDETRGAVYVFRRNEAGMWTETVKISARDVAAGEAFGRAMAVGDGVALVAAWGHQEGRGAVYALVRDGSGQWSEGAKLMASDAEPLDWFGMSLAMEGEYALIGTPRKDQGRGGAYVFRRGADGGWTETARLEPDEPGRNIGFGSAVALRGGVAMIGVPSQDGFAGAVHAYVLDESTGEWRADEVYRPFDGQQGTQFGSAITISGGEVWIAGPGAGGFEGRYYVMSPEAGGDGWGAMTKFSVDGLSRGDQMGTVLALSEDVGVVGLGGDDYGLGTAAIIEREGDGWNGGIRVASEVVGLDPITGDEVACEDGSASVFSCANVDIVSFLPVQQLGGGRGAEVSDVWGWTDPVTGKEWAIVGRYDGTAFIDLSDPGHPRYVGNLPLTEGATPSVWRDIKVYADHAFIVADGAGRHGMQIFDLTRLRDVTGDPATFEETSHYDQIHSAHNIVINEATGFAYSVGSSGGGDSCGGGLHMIDIRDPLNPVFAGCFADAATGRAQTGYSHDAMCIIYNGPDTEHRGKEICFGSNETALSIADVSDNSAPVALAMSTYPSASYSHQGWIDEAHEYFYMNDELDELDGMVANTRTLVWDVKDLDDPVLVTEYMSENTSSDHNLYIRGDFMYQSNYVSGLRVLDISDRENPVEIGFFDTVPWGDDAPGFDGSWSNYPYFESGIIVVTSGKEGVFFVKRAPRVLIP